jgi:hypothetical protein
MSVDVSVDGADAGYYDGYDDGYHGYHRKCNDPDYLEGYFDGLRDSGELGYYEDFDEWE